MKMMYGIRNAPRVQREDCGIRNNSGGTVRKYAGLGTPMVYGERMHGIRNASRVCRENIRN